MNNLFLTAVAGTMLAGTAIAGPNESNGAKIEAAPRVAFKALAVVVGSDGTLIRGHARTSVILPDGSADGNYRVEFGKNVAGCVFTGVLGTTGSSGVVAPGYLTVAGDVLSANGVFVETFNSSGTLTASSFHLLVSC